MNYNEIEGNLIELAKQGKFNVIAHGCNCFCTMGAGIAPQMAHTFFANTFKKEAKKYKGDINKLGTIDYNHITDKGDHLRISNPNDLNVSDVLVTVVNAYTQFNYGGVHPLDYEALTLCLRKMNNLFGGAHIGLPQIGCGLAGGDWNIVKSIIQRELKDCKVTVVIFKK